MITAEGKRIVAAGGQGDLLDDEVARLAEEDVVGAGSAGVVLRRGVAADRDLRTAGIGDRGGAGAGLVLIDIGRTDRRPGRAVLRGGRLVEIVRVHHAARGRGGARIRSFTAAGGAGFDLHQTDFPCAGLGSGAFVAKAYLNLLADEFLDVHSSGGDEGPVAAGRISGDGELLPFAADRTYIHEPLLAHRAGVASGVLDGEQGARGVGQVDLRFHGASGRRCPDAVDGRRIHDAGPVLEGAVDRTCLARLLHDPCSLLPVGTRDDECKGKDCKQNQKRFLHFPPLRQLYAVRWRGTY